MPPTIDNIKPESDSMSPPQIEGTNPPTVEPIKNPSQTSFFPLIEISIPNEHATIFRYCYFEEILMAAEGYHEPYEQLTVKTLDLHRAIRSLMEEFEAIDWYQQRVDACKDDELRAVLAHNRDEEKEHAAMVLEWIRRHDAVLDVQLKKYLFTTASIVQKEEGSKGESGSGAAATGSSVD